MFEKVFDYIYNSAPLLFFKLDREGRILDMNRFAAGKVGPLSPDAVFSDLIVDFEFTFDLETLIHSSDREHLLTLNTPDQQLQSFLFEFTLSNSHILVFGRSETKDLGKMQAEMITLNRDFANLNRQLQKKNAQLQHAMDHVKTLQGIIPICMHCHKIRNDKQIWDRLEAYLSEHTEAQLSHGICPECMEKYYSDLYDDDDDKGHGNP
ncbi:MAG: hypothetical protein K9J83_05015 [Desulfarculaceae bacterium]|nr:hypothetical protein [Desulfarculaceae bacterium]